MLDLPHAIGEELLNHTMLDEPVFWYNYQVVPTILPHITLAAPQP